MNTKAIIQIYRRFQNVPEKYADWLIAVLLMILGLSILSPHTYYLNHLEWQHWDQYLTPNWNNHSFLITLYRVRTWIFFIWIGVVLYCLYFSEKALRAKKYRVNWFAYGRSVLAGLIFCITVAPYNPPDIELSPYFFINSIAYGLMTCAFFLLPFSKEICRAVGRQLLLILRLPGYVWCIAAATAVFSTAYALSDIVFHHVPMPYDSTAEYIQAKIIAGGHWYMPTPPWLQFFNLDLMIHDSHGKWYSQYPPGHPMALAVGMLLGNPAMVNPFMGAMTSVAIYLLAKEAFGLHTAKIAALLSALCVYMIFMSAEFMSHATSLMTGTLFMWAYLRAINRPSWLYGMIGGAALGYCFITRPYTALAFSIVPAAYALYLVAIRPRMYIAPMAIMAAMTLSFVGFQLYYNSVTTGDPYVFGYQVMKGNWHNPFRTEAIHKLTHRELEKNLRENIQRVTWLHRMLFEWPIPALSLVALLIGLRGNRRNEALIFLTILMHFISCQFLPGNVDGTWGARLVYESIGMIIVLCAKGITMLPAFLRLLSTRRHAMSMYYGAGFLLLMSFYGFAFQHSLQLDTLWRINRLYKLSPNPGFYEYIAPHVETPALVFLPYAQYVWVSYTVPPSDDSPIIFAIDLGAQNTQLVKHYSNRNAYVTYYNGRRQVIIHVK